VGSVMIHKYIVREELSVLIGCSAAY
jgi:hypothetical protein